MRVLERILLVVAVASSVFLLLERFEVVDLQEESRRRERSRLVAQLEVELTSKLDRQIGERVESETAALKAQLATELAAQLEGKLTNELVPALKSEVKTEIETAIASERRGSEIPDSLTLREVNITNAAGKVVIRLAASDGGGGEVSVARNDGRRVARLYARVDQDGELDLYDEHSVLRANIGGNTSGGYCNFWSRSGDSAVYIGADSGSESGYIALYGPKEKKALELVVNERGGLARAREFLSGLTVGTFGVASDTGTGLISLADVSGKPGLVLYSTADGGQVKAVNSDGNTAAFLGVSSSPAGNGLTYVSNRSGTRIVESGANTKLGGYTSYYGSKGKRVIFLGGSTGDAPDDGVMELATTAGKLGVVLRAYPAGSSVRVYDGSERVKSQLR